MNYIKNTINHFKTITSHKITVTKLCFKVGLYKQGIKHDLSKYSFVEFSSGVKYYQGTRSPIAREKELNGYSEGWLHHKGRNKHHYEYWSDKDLNGIYYVEMPINYVYEMVLDRIAACMTYENDNFTNQSPLNYYKRVNEGKYMHPNTQKELERLLKMIATNGIDYTLIAIKKEIKSKK